MSVAAAESTSTVWPKMQKNINQSSEKVELVLAEFFISAVSA